MSAIDNLGNTLLSTPEYNFQYSSELIKFYQNLPIYTLGTSIYHSKDISPYYYRLWHTSSSEIDSFIKPIRISNTVGPCPNTISQYNKCIYSTGLYTKILVKNTYCYINNSNILAINGDSLLNIYVAESNYLILVSSKVYSDYKDVYTGLISKLEAAFLKLHPHYVIIITGDDVSMPHTVSLQDNVRSLQNISEHSDLFIDSLNKTFNKYDYN